MENNENLKTEVQNSETQSEVPVKPKEPRVLVKATVLKRGETWLFVEQTNEWFKTGKFKEGASFLITVPKFNETAKDIKEGRTYEFLLDPSADVDKVSKRLKLRYWLSSFRQAEF